MYESDPPDPDGTPIAVIIAAPPAPLACTECRMRHVRCDAEMPVCSRCHQEERQCQYVLSRRGYKGPRKRPRVESIPNSMTGGYPNGGANSISVEQISSTTVDCPVHAGTSIASTGPKIPQLFPPTTTTLSKGIHDQGFYMHALADVKPPFCYLDAQTATQKTSRPSSIVDETRADRLQLRALIEDPEKMAFMHSLRAYYRYFHNAHPILLPEKILFNSMFEKYPSYLKNVMHFIGSHYESASLTETVCITIGHELLNNTARDGFMVQALLLYAIALHARDEQIQARQILSSAIEIALKLGMHWEGFAVDNSHGSRHLAESWRQTIWELYVVDGMLTFHMHERHRLFNEDIEVILPYDEITEADPVVSPFANF